MVDGNDDLALRINVKIFERDEPELYLLMFSLPRSTARRHKEIVSLLKLGVIAQRFGGVLPKVVAPQVEPTLAVIEPGKQDGQASSKAVERLREKVMPAPVKEAPESPEEPFYEEINIAEEIAAMYGGAD